MRKLAKILITLGVFYWVLMVVAALSGCKTCENCDSCEVIYQDEVTISLDPMDKKDWHQREEFLRHFE